jgi:hypothetical protein
VPELLSALARDDLFHVLDIVAACPAVTRTRIAGPEPIDEAIADLERSLDAPEKAPSDEGKPRELPQTDYRPIVAVIAVVIFSLGMIAFLRSLRMR